MDPNQNPTNQQAPQQQFVMPPFRIFKVKRTDSATGEFVTLELSAHSVTYDASQNGVILCFYDYTMDETFGVQKMLRRVLDQCHELEEVDNRFAQKRNLLVN